MRIPTPAMQVAVALAALAALAGAPARPDDERSIDERCRAEILELHEFLEEWSNAELPDSEEAFRRFSDVIAPGFVIVDPHGSMVGRQPIVDAIRRSHGRWQAAPGRIRIERYRLHHEGGGFALATYEEWHDLGEASVGRLSSVLFGTNADTPNGLEWLHLHEVWIQPREGGE